MSATQFTNYKTYTYYYLAPYISMEMGIDHFDTLKRRDFISLVNEKEIPENSLIIWDSWFAVTEMGISLEQLQQDERLKEIKSFSSAKSKFVIFEKRK